MGYSTDDLLGWRTQPVEALFQLAVSADRLSNDLRLSSGQRLSDGLVVDLPRPKEAGTVAF
jgi:hypothetical protein